MAGTNPANATIDPVIDLEIEKISREIFSQLTLYENGSHIGVTFLLYVMVVIGVLMSIYTIVIISIRSHRWTVQSFLLFEMVVVHSFFMPITLIHPYAVLVFDKFVVLTMSPLQKWPVIQGLILAYYFTFVYTFATAVSIILTNFLRLKWQKNHTESMSGEAKALLSVMNLPLTAICIGGFSWFFEFVETPNQINMPPGYAIIDISAQLYSVITFVFFITVVVYMGFSYWIYKQVERVMRTSTFEEKSREYFNLELQMLFGCFYGAFPFLILISSFLMYHTNSRIIVSEFVTFTIAVLPIFSSFLTLSAHRSLHWPRLFRNCQKQKTSESQWATRREQSHSSYGP